jgi:hypothetical protein
MSEMAYIGIRAQMTSYSAGNGAEVFWYSKRNFFLDGDDLAVDRLPFIDSESLYEVMIILAQPGESGVEQRRVIDGTSRIEEHHYSGPFQLPLRISLLLRGSLDRSKDRIGEVRVSKGFEFYGRFGFYLDMRYVTYDIDAWSGSRDFLNTYAAVYGRLNDDSWVRIGIGASPHLYDRWMYQYSGFGREHYLLGHDLIDAFSGGVTGEALEALREAERALSEDWAITFEAFIGFW